MGLQKQERPSSDAGRSVVVGSGASEWREEAKDRYGRSGEVGSSRGCGTGICG